MKWFPPSFQVFKSRMDVDFRPDRSYEYAGITGSRFTACLMHMLKLADHNGLFWY